MLVKSFETHPNDLALREGIGSITELVQLAITQNASITIDQQEYARRYNSLAERFYRAKERQDLILTKTAARKAKRDTLMSFSVALTGSPACATEFTPELWNALVDQAQVSPDGEYGSP